MSKEIGDRAELLAKQYLLKQGLKCLVTNYACRWGEIDLVMQDKQYLVFVEVRARQSILFGGALASITLSKRQKLLKTAQHYLMTHALLDKTASRFDVVIFEGALPQIEWIKNVFDLNY